MLMLLSPSKTLDEKAVQVNAWTSPIDVEKTSELVALLQKKSIYDLQKLMGISEAIATLNYGRYLHWESAPAYEALSLFKGDVYAAMDVAHYTGVQRDFAQKHLRILSGLYGLIAPHDAIRPYRLEMGVGLENPKGKNLYAFWGDRITDVVNQALAASGSDQLINLASQEYAKAVKPKGIKGRFIQVEFRVKKDGKLHTIGLFAKRARGMMANYVITKGITSSDKLLDFNVDGYVYSPELSSGDGNTLFFVRN